MAAHLIDRFVDLRHWGIDIGSHSGKASRNDQTNEPDGQLVQTFLCRAGRVVSGRAGRQVVGGAIVRIAVALMGPVA